MKSKNLLILLLLVNGVSGQTFPIKNGFNIDGGNPVTDISIDATMVSNSDEALVSEKAIKTYVDTEVSSVTLDDVTTNGNTTTNSITTGNHLVNTSGLGTMTSTPGVDIRNSTTNSEAVVAFSTGDAEYDVGKFWTGINQTLGYGIGYGSEFSFSNTALRIETDNTVTLPNATLADTKATGNHVLTTSTGIVLNDGTDIRSNTFGDKSLVFSYLDATNIEHIWVDDTDNTFHFVADGAYKGEANANIEAGSFNGVDVVALQTEVSNLNLDDVTTNGNSTQNDIYVTSPPSPAGSSSSRIGQGIFTASKSENATDLTQSSSTISEGFTSYLVSNSVPQGVGLIEFSYNGSEHQYGVDVLLVAEKGLQVEDNNGNNALVVDGTTGDVTLPNTIASEITDAKAVVTKEYVDSKVSTFTPTFTSTGATFSMADAVGSYIKNGRQVTLNLFLKVSSVSNITDSRADIAIGGLPFPVTGLLGNTSVEASGSVSYRNYMDFLTGHVSIAAFEPGVLKLLHDDPAEPNDTEWLMVENFPGGAEFRASITYITD